MKSLPSKVNENEIAEIKAFQLAYVRQFTAHEQDVVKRLGLLTHKYEQALERLQSDLVKAGDLKEAAIVNKARNLAQLKISDLKKRLAELTPEPARDSGK